MEIGKKIYLGYGIVLALFVIVMAISVYQVDIMTGSYEYLFNNQIIDRYDMRSIEIASRIEQVEFRGYFAFPSEQEMYSKNMFEQDRIIDENVEKVRKSFSNQKDSQIDIGNLNEIVAVLTKYRAAREKMLSIAQNNLSEAFAYDVKEIRPMRLDLYSKIQKELDDLEKEIQQGRVETKQISDFQTLLQLIGLILAAVLGTGIAFYTVRNINKQLKDAETQRNIDAQKIRATSFYSRSLIEVSLDPLVTISKEGKITDVNKSTELITGVSRERLTGSDFSDYFTEPDKAREGYQQVFSKGMVKDYPLAIRHSSGKVTDVLYNASVYKNEAGEVQGVFAAARDVTESKKMNEKLNEQVRGIKEAVVALTSSAAQIATSTKEFAASSAQITSSVSETTSTAEEVKQTATLATDKAESISKESAENANLAKQGSQSVKQAVEGINSIKVQNALVAQSIIKLSEQSQAIGDIISSVNDIAEQSNLLAVNAAIEAAKAGEHGKGFTVVAQEVKTLADQSKQATEQVRTILKDIQKATSSAVMSTEKVTKAVEVGVKQFSESGDAIDKIAVRSAVAADASIQILSSSQQQLVGMKQITQAMESIKQASEQTLAGAKQLEKAAQEINRMGQKLNELVK